MQRIREEEEEEEAAAADCVVDLERGDLVAEGKRQKPTGIVRHKPRPEQGISAEDRAVREAHVRELKRLFPNQSPQVLEWAWNFWHRTPESRMGDLISEWDKERDAVLYGKREGEEEEPSHPQPMAAD